MLRRIATGLLCALTLLPAATGCRRTNEPPTPEPPSAEANELLRLRNLAVAYLEAEDPAATSVLDELARRLPEEAMVSANRGLVALRESRLEAAAAHLEKAGRLAPDHPDIAMLRALCAVYGGDDAAARVILAHAVERNPDHHRVRWALFEILDRDRSGSGAEALAHLERLADQAPGNLVVRLALARHRLERGEGEAAANLLSTLDPSDVTADERPLLESALTRIAEGNPGAARALVIALDNTLKPGPAWQASNAALKGPRVPVAEPIWDFVGDAVDDPAFVPRSIDVAWRDAGSPPGLEDLRAVRAVTIAAPEGRGGVVAAVTRDTVEFHALGADGRYARTARFTLPPDLADDDAPPRLVALDWNNDRRIDLAAAFADGSVRLWLSGEDGDWAPAATPLLAPTSGRGPAPRLIVWDADHDGDLDLLACRTGRPPALLRNNGDGTASDLEAGLDLATGGTPELVDATVVDLDDDGDLDLAAVTSEGAVLMFDNERSGRFVGTAASGAPGDASCITAADLDNDGRYDLAVVTADGAVHVLANPGAEVSPATRIVHEGDPPGAPGATSASLHTLDFDNDGFLDLLVVAGTEARLLRNEGGLRLAPAQASVPRLAGIRDADVIDHDGDGDEDLLVTEGDGRCAIRDNEGGNRHGWQKVGLQAIVEGGQRNNAYGVGGVIEVRAGRAYQKRLVTGPVTHLGLGAFGPADAVRVVWPNGVPANIVKPAPNQFLVEEQSLKGSCPFLFAFDGERLRFVTDMLWRSPLGMRINAQTVAPVITTRDYVKVEAAQLRERDGHYDIAVTAALWETIYIDEIRLLAVDRPDDVDIFVDERFVAPVPPPFRIETVGELLAPRSAVDDRGRDVLDVIAARDGRRLGGFGKGRFQGVTRPHHVELDLGAWTEPQTVRLFASGWTMPTDTSINVAMAQGRHAPPSALSVWVADGAGGWVEAIPNAGFPAGKLKTIVLDLSGLFPTSDHRVQLRTNLEVYWDRLAFAVGALSFAPDPVSLATRRADLEYAGFPTMVRADELAPDVPDYAHGRQTPRWRDLEGYYTRYGDVRELLAETDDRYVIMNAGDAIALSFDAPPPPPAGWTRDFVLFSDGWVKDGDLNTAASQTVTPLPFHAQQGYPSGSADRPPSLAPDHPDWMRFHTRYVTSEPFRGRMRPPE